MTNEWTNKNVIRDHVTQPIIVNQIIEEAAIYSQLDDDRVVRRFNTSTLRGRIPIASIIEAIPVEELEISDINTPTYTHIDYELEKHRVKLGISDEAYIDLESDMLVDYQQNAASRSLARYHDYDIARIIKSNPQIIKYDTESHNFFTVILPTIIDTIFPYQITSCVMSQKTAIKFWVSLGETFDDHTKIPYVDIPIIISERLTGGMYFISTDVPAIGFALGKTISREFNENHEGGKILQIDDFSCAFSLIQTIDGKNKGIICVQINGIGETINVNPNTITCTNDDILSFDADVDHVTWSLTGAQSESTTLYQSELIRKSRVTIGWDEPHGVLILTASKTGYIDGNAVITIEWHLALDNYLFVSRRLEKVIITANHPETSWSINSELSTFESSSFEDTSICNITIGENETSPKIIVKAVKGNEFALATINIRDPFKPQIIITPSSDQIDINTHKSFTSNISDVSWELAGFTQSPGTYMRSLNNTATVYIGWNEHNTKFHLVASKTGYLTGEALIKANWYFDITPTECTVKPREIINVISNTPNVSWYLYSQASSIINIVKTETISTCIILISMFESDDTISLIGAYENDIKTCVIHIKIPSVIETKIISDKTLFMPDQSISMYIINIKTESQIKLNKFKFEYINCTSSFTKCIILDDYNMKLHIGIDERGRAGKLTFRARSIDHSISSCDFDISLILLSPYEAYLHKEEELSNKIRFTLTPQEVEIREWIIEPKNVDVSLYFGDHYVDVLINVETKERLYTLTAIINDNIKVKSYIHVCDGMIIIEPNSVTIKNGDEYVFTANVHKPAWFVESPESEIRGLDTSEFDTQAKLQVGWDVESLQFPVIASKENYIPGKSIVTVDWQLLISPPEITLNRKESAQFLSCTLETNWKLKEAVNSYITHIGSDEKHSICEVYIDEKETQSTIYLIGTARKQTFSVSININDPLPVSDIIITPEKTVVRNGEKIKVVSNVKDVDWAISGISSINKVDSITAKLSVNWLEHSSTLTIGCFRHGYDYVECVIIVNYGFAFKGSSYNIEPGESINIHANEPDLIWEIEPKSEYTTITEPINDEFGSYVTCNIDVMETCESVFVIYASNQMEKISCIINVVTPLSISPKTIERKLGDEIKFVTNYPDVKWELLDTKAPETILTRVNSTCYKLYLSYFEKSPVVHVKVTSTEYESTDIATVTIKHD